MSVLLFLLDCFITGHHRGTTRLYKKLLIPFESFLSSRQFTVGKSYFVRKKLGLASNYLTKESDSLFVYNKGRFDYWQSICTELLSVNGLYFCVLYINISWIFSAFLKYFWLVVHWFLLLLYWLFAAVLLLGPNSKLYWKAVYRKPTVKKRWSKNIFMDVLSTLYFVANLCNWVNYFTIEYSVYYIALYDNNFHILYVAIVF